MKRPWLILACGIGVAVAGYLCVYFGGTATGRSLHRNTQPELAWLKQEYQLTDDQFARVVELHVAYLPTCREMCRRIDEKNAQLKKLLAGANMVTPEIKKALAESAQVRSDCQAAMLQHFYEVSRVMPPDQGKRYLAWLQQQTLAPSHTVPTEPPELSSTHERRVH